MKPLQTGFLLSLMLAMACTTVEGGETWTFVESGDEAQSEDCGEPAEPAAWDCPAFDTNELDPEELPFALYRYFACRRSVEENFLFSPAAIRLAMGELASELDGAEGRAIAEKLGGVDVRTIYEEGEEYRRVLLDRRPKPSTGRIYQEWDDYDLDEDDPERLLSAVGIEFFSSTCDGTNDESCRWVPHNDRWSESFLHEPVHRARESAGPIPTQAMMLRAQWENIITRSTNSNWPFLVSEDLTVHTYAFTHSVITFAIVDAVSIFKWRIVGGDLSMILIGSSTKDLADIEAALSSTQLQTWLDSLSPLPYFRSLFFIPEFDLQETVDISPAFELPHQLPTTTRLSMGERGINSPEPLELQLEPPTRIIVNHFDLNRYYFNSPFLFLVYDHPTESILMMGRVANPAHSSTSASSVQ